MSDGWRARLARQVMVDRDVAWARGRSTGGCWRPPRRSLERTGGALTGRISVADPDDAERKAIIGITGVHQSAGTKRLTRVAGGP